MWKYEPIIKVEVSRGSGGHEKIYLEGVNEEVQAVKQQPEQVRAAYASSFEMHHTNRLLLALPTRF